MASAQSRSQTGQSPPGWSKLMESPDLRGKGQKTEKVMFQIRDKRTDTRTSADPSILTAIKRSLNSYTGLVTGVRV